MNIQLVVVRAFGAHVRGDVITDQTQINAILASENADCVVKVLLSGKGA